MFFLSFFFKCPVDLFPRCFFFQDTSRKFFFWYLSAVLSPIFLFLCIFGSIFCVHEFCAFLCNFIVFVNCTNQKWQSVRLLPPHLPLFIILRISGRENCLKRRRGRRKGEKSGGGRCAEVQSKMTSKGAESVARVKITRCK